MRISLLSSIYLAATGLAAVGAGLAIHGHTHHARPKQLAQAASPHVTPITAGIHLPQLAVGKVTIDRAAHVTATMKLWNFGKGSLTQCQIKLAQLAETDAEKAVGRRITMTHTAKNESAPFTLNFPLSVPSGDQTLKLTLTAGGRSFNVSRIVNVP